MAERILVVDDKIEIANLIEVYLKNENYEVLKCYTADEADRIRKWDAPDRKSVV